MKTPRDNEIAKAAAIAAALSEQVSIINSFDNEQLAGYIVMTEQMLKAAKEEQARRIGKVFLPPNG